MMLHNGKTSEDNPEDLLERIKVLEYCLGIQNNLPIFPLSLELDKIRNTKLMQEVTVKFERTHLDAVLPTVAYEGDACFDLMAVEDTIIPPATLVKSEIDFKTAQQILGSVGEVIVTEADGTTSTVTTNSESAERVKHLTLEEFLEKSPGLKSAVKLEAKTVQIGKEFVPVGLKMELPLGWEATFRTRSGAGVKKSLRIHPGTIDAGYRGDLAVAVYNMSGSPELVKKGQGIAQVAIRPVPKVTIIEGQVELNSQRGEKGFGSSDKV